jgi:RHS repeat-associated protein
MKGFTYDKAGNRTKDTTDGIDTDFIPNNMNQLTKVSPKGPLHFQGRTNQPAAVEVEGQAAGMDAEHVFSTQLPLASSVVQISITAQTPGGQVITQHYEVKRDRDLVYDLNGNLINDGQRTYTWDAANRLVKVSVLDPTTGLSSRTSEFTYDGLWRRVRMLEKDGVVTTADRRFIWVGAEIKEERNAVNQVQKRFYGMGVQQVAGDQAGNYYYQLDHLGSVRSVLNSSGVEVAKYDFDLWGKRTKISGTFDADMGYTGHFQHEASGLALTWFRAYDPKRGRWLSRDPIGEMGGINLYGYSANAPSVRTDPLGLFCYASLFMSAVNLGDAVVFEGIAIATVLATGSQTVIGNVPLSIALAMSLGWSLSIALDSAIDAIDAFKAAVDGKFWNDRFKNPANNLVTKKSLEESIKRLGMNVVKGPRFAGVVGYLLEREHANNPHNPIFSGCE